MSNKIPLTSDLHSFPFENKDRNPFEIYDNLQSNNTEVQYELPKDQPKPIKVINLLTINGKKLNNDIQPSSIKHNNESLISNITKHSHMFKFCSQRNDYIRNVHNNGLSSEIDLC
jgi:hypothetical protein